MSRWSIVREMKINSISLASILQIGDNESIKSKAKAIAVQRQVATFLENEGNLDNYQLFSRVIPIPEVYEQVDMEVENLCDHIQVNCIRVLAISSSSVMQVGTNYQIENESRVKHFRQFVTKE
ncbi:spore germination protein PE [Paenibacillus sp. 1_12]|uniref:spore germination protein GerPE n=1 Tax=Paenibacillus sp. 1_12 TaxID=1566278 RepID=UPI0008F16967|nr:spore germination protein GerPE [Paenibacillus sp. 1_12]SFL44382.1 spore germination protein PE [Paenibacillus sp. 1_12]